MKKSSERIEEEIDGIRNRMRDRVDTAAREFSPRAIAARMTGKEDPSPTELLEWAVRRARNNPVSTALVAVGLLGFATQSSERTRRLTRDGWNEGSKRVRGYAHDAGDIAVEKADDALHYAREAGETAGRAIRRTSHDVERYARRGAGRSAELSKDGADWVRHNPTATGLFALAVGAAAASVFAARRRQDPVLKRLGTDEPAPARAPRASRTPATATKPATAKSATSRKSTSAATGSTASTRSRKAKTGAEKTAAKARATRATKPAGSTAATRSPKPQSTTANNGTTATSGIPSTTPSNESQIH